jgi:hypothetical protein
LPSKNNRCPLSISISSSTHKIIGIIQRFSLVKSNAIPAPNSP